MLELIALILIVLLFFGFLKLFIHIGIFIITLPIKILAAILSVFVVVFVLIPLELVSGIAALLLAPLALLLPLIPLFLLGLGVYLLIKNS